MQFFGLLGGDYVRTFLRSDLKCVRKSRIPKGAMKIAWGAEIALTAKNV